MCEAKEMGACGDAHETCDQTCRPIEEPVVTPEQAQALEAAEAAQPEMVGGLPLWDEAMFAFLEGVQERAERIPLDRTEATALVLSWMISGLAKNVDELAMIAGSEPEGNEVQRNAKLIADICGAFVGQMKNDISAIMGTRNRIRRVQAISDTRLREELMRRLRG